MRKRTRLAGLPVALGAAALAFLPSAPAQSTPLACVDDCSILAHFFAYVAPVTEVASGASVSWESLDVSHPTGEMGAADPCFRAEMSGSTSSAPVDFSIVDGGVVATSDGRSKPCTTAIDLGGIAYALPYQCLVHPNMIAALVVSP